MKTIFEKINVKIFWEKNDWRKIFSHENFLNVGEKFFQDRDEKKHNFYSHVKWFFKKIKLNTVFRKQFSVKKWEICLVDFWMNIWNEINWHRPALVFSKNKWVSNVFVIPISSFKEDSFVSKYDLIINWNDENWLKIRSVLKIEQMKIVSKNRFIKNKTTWWVVLIWKIKNDLDIESINNLIKIFLFW